MPFGFDPSLILAQTKVAEPTPNETLRTLADLANSRMNRQVQGATLGDLLRRQQREAALADIYRQNATTPESLPSALMRGGFGQQAFDAQDQAVQVATQRAQQNKLARELYDLGMQRLRNQVAAIKTPEQYGQFVARIPREERVSYGLPETYDPAALEAFSVAGIPAETQRQMAEKERHNREMEKRPPGGLMVPVQVQGEGGMQYFVAPPPLKPGAPAAPIVDAEGKPIIKPATKAPKSLNKGDRDELERLFGEEQGISDLVSRFKPQFAGKGPLGNAEVEFNQKLGSMASDAGQAEAAFWADFAKRVDLPERNKTFGSSLTATEKSSWDQAKNIRPGVKPELVEAQLRRMARIIADVKARRGRSLAKDGYSQAAIEEYTGPLGLDEAAENQPSGGATKRRTAAEIRAELDALRKAGAK